MQTNLSDVEGRVKRYWYTDGLGELIGGGMFILLGIYFALQNFVGQDSMLGGILQVSLILLLIGLVWIGRRLINTLKTRLTYPRTGYVELRVNDKENRLRRGIAIVLAFTISVLTFSFVLIFKSFDSIVAVTGFVVGMILLLLRAKSGVPRFYILGGVSIALGFLISVSKLSSGYSLGLYYGLMGLCFMISGGLTLRHYLMEHPLPAVSQNG